MKTTSALGKFVLEIFLVWLFVGCGTHGSIKGYQYCTEKNILEQAVMKVIRNNSNIGRDTSFDYLGSSPLLDNTNGSGNYEAGQNFYNDIKHYVTVIITSDTNRNQYTFRYYGDEKHWETSANSEIFICYAFDKNHNGGSEGNGGITKKMVKEFTEVFEKEFISKLDEELKLKHTNSN